MKILYLEWKSYCNEFMLDAMKNDGHDVRIFNFPKEDGTRLNEELASKIAEAVISEAQSTDAGFDFVFSFNYFPVAAVACKATRTRYISWVYDSPFVQVYSDTVLFPTNSVFIFDHSEYERLRALGVKTVCYLPMAGAYEYYDKMIPSPYHHSRYDCDIAFIGSTYTEEKHNLFRHLEELDDYTKGYLRGIMDAQKKIQGANLIEKSLTPQIMDNVHKVCAVYENGDGLESAEWIFANYFINRKITSEERIELLRKCSEEAGPYKVNLYTNGPTPELPKVNNSGPIDYYDAAPYAIKCAKINLNISLRSIESGIPLRAFDIMACGGFLLTNYQGDMPEFFTPDEDFVYYSDPDDMLNKINYYLAHESERNQIALNGYNKIKQGHSYTDRLHTMLEIAFS